MFDKPYSVGVMDSRGRREIYDLVQDPLEKMIQTFLSPFVHTLHYADTAIEGQMFKSPVKGSMFDVPLPPAPTLPEYPRGAISLGLLSVSLTEEQAADFNKEKEDYKREMEAFEKAQTERQKLLDARVKQLEEVSRRLNSLTESGEKVAIGLLPPRQE